MSNITVIPATKMPFAHAKSPSVKRRRVAAYARVSTDKDEQYTSYQAQVDYYTKYINSRADWEIAGVYTDEGITGTSTKHREGFKQMLSDAFAGKIDLILTKSVSRFARNTVDSLTAIRDLKAKGVEVYFEKENIYTLDNKGEVLITIMSTLAQDESRNISENTTWGQRKRMADGKASIPFSMVLGFKRGPNGEFLIDYEEAKLVKRIYNMYLSGFSPNAIARILSDEGIPSPQGKPNWPGSTVMSILTNEKYIGDARLQKTYTTDYLTKKHKKNNGEIPQYYVKDHHEAIIDRDVYELIKAQLQKNPVGAKHYGTSIFSGRIFCGQCGHAFGAKVWHSNDKYRNIIYRCNDMYGKGHAKCTTGKVTEESIKEGFVKAVNTLIADHDNIAKVENPRRFSTAALEEKKTELEEKLKSITVEVEKLVQANSITIQDQEAYKTSYEEYEKQYADVKAELDSVNAEILEKKRLQVLYKQFQKTFANLTQPLEEFKEDIWFALLDHITVNSPEDVKYTFRNGSVL